MKPHHFLLLATLPALAYLPVAVPALPQTCADPCTITAFTLGYSPPAVALADGATVRWQSIDVSHPEGEAFATNPCFVASTGIAAPSPPVRFDLSGGSLTATTDPGTQDEITQTCSMARPLPDGSMLLVYRCLLHPNMVGTLSVGP